MWYGKYVKWISYLFTILFVIICEDGLANNRQIALISDAEIETLVADYTRPLLKAAGLHVDIKVILVNDQTFNAFVDGQRVFINIGTLMQAETPNEVIGVLAHEVGHLAGGHLYRLREKIRQTQTFAVIGMLIGAGTSLAGGLSRNAQVGLVGSGLAIGSSEVAMRILMKYQRGDEVAADRLAISYLNKTQQSSSGLLKTFEHFTNSLIHSGTQIDPYIISHPLPHERIAAIKVLATKSQYFKKKDPISLQQRHDKIRAKIAGFTGDKLFLQRISSSELHRVAAIYGESILAARDGNLHTALKKINKLVAEHPGNPYFREFLGDVLILDNSSHKAVEAYKKAIKIDKQGSAQLHIKYGHASLLTGNANDVALAIIEIKKGIEKEPGSVQAYRFLAMAYGRQGKIALAELATAEMYYYEGNYKQARIFSLRAVPGLLEQSADWVRAQDIIKITDTTN